MTYLYGDSTSSELKSNFLEFLRDALDFCAFALQADARIKQGRAQIQKLGEESEAETARLERFISSVQRAVHNGEKGTADSPTARCAAHLGNLILDAHRASVDGIRHDLAEATARIEAEEAATRDACVRALGSLLAPHEPPGCRNTMQVSLGDGRYKAIVDGQAEPGLAWTLEGAIPDGHAWTSVMRVDRLVSHLEIRAPQLAGWITKEVRVKPQRIERFLVTKVIDEETKVFMELRAEASQDIGFNFDVSLVEGSVKAVRVAPSDDASAGPFEITLDDVPVLTDLATKLRASLVGLERRPNIAATFEGSDFRTLPAYVEIVERMIAMMAPIVREITKRSLTPNELILRRQLTNDRREEIFVAKATLREKYTGLPPEMKKLFEPLGLDVVERTKASERPSEKLPIRSELPPSPGIQKPLAIPPAPLRPRSVPPTDSAPPPAVPSSPAGVPRPGAPPAPSPPPKTLKPPDGAPPPRPGSGTLPAVTKASSPPDAPMIEVLHEADDIGEGEETAVFADTDEIAAEHLEEEEEEEEEEEVEAEAEATADEDDDKEDDDKEDDDKEDDDKEDDDKEDDDKEDDDREDDDKEDDDDGWNAPEPIEPPPPPSTSNPLPKSDGHPRNEALVATLKKINTLTRNGRGGDAYHEYASLFSSSAFVGYRVEEQRQALRLMVMAKNHPSDRDAVAAAFRAALNRIKALIDTSNEPGDQELLGVALLSLGDETAATAAFQAGLELERARNPQSDLVATLMRRVSQI